MSRFVILQSTCRALIMYSWHRHDKEIQQLKTEKEDQNLKRNGALILELERTRHYK